MCWYHGSIQCCNCATHNAQNLLLLVLGVSFCRAFCRTMSHYIDWSKVVLRPLDHLHSGRHKAPWKTHDGFTISIISPQSIGTEALGSWLLAFGYLWCAAGEKVLSKGLVVQHSKHVLSGTVPKYLCTVLYCTAQYAVRSTEYLPKPSTSNLQKSKHTKLPK